MVNPNRNTSKQSLSRRELLKALGVGAFGAAAASTGILGGAYRALAQTATPARASAFMTVPIGDVELTVMQEGIIPIPPMMFGANVSEDAAANALAENNLPNDIIGSTVNVTMLRTGDRLVLLDTGLGELPFTGSSNNRLVPTLNVLGIAAEDITDVVISHFHPDHIGGASTNDGVITFPNATYYMSDVEYDFVQNTSGTPVDEYINAAKARLQPIIDADHFQTFGVDAEIVPGLTAVHTPGHTLGHVSYYLSGGSDQIFVSNDVANHYLLALGHPDWYMGFDTVPDLAVETRRSIFGMIADEKLRVIGYHFPFPGIGYIDRDGDGFRYLPTGY